MDRQSPRLTGDMRKQLPGHHNGRLTPSAGKPIHGGPQEGEIDWRRWAYVLWKRKWWILLITVLGTGSAFWFARSEHPVYEAKAMLWFETPDRPGTMATPIEIVNVFSTPAWADLLRSYAVMDGVVHELQMYLSPDNWEDRDLFQDFELTDENASGTYRLVVRLDESWALLNAEDSVVQVVAAGATLGEDLGFRWSPPPGELAPGREVPFTLRPPRAVADGLANRLNIEMDQSGGNFLRVSLRSGNPRRAAHLLNTILDHFVGVAAELKRQKLTKLATTLDEQLSQATQRLRRAEAELQQYRVNTITLPEDRRRTVMTPQATQPPLSSSTSTGEEPTISLGSPSYTQGAATVNTSDPVFDRYFSLQVERDRIRQDRRDLQEVLREFETSGNLDVMGLEIVPSVRTSSSLVSALQELGQKELEHRTLLYRYTPEHAEVERSAAALDKLRTQTVPALVSQLIDRLEAREAELEREIEKQSGELEGIPPRAIEESRLRREVALAEQLHNQLQIRYKEAQVAEAATSPNVRILDRAAPPPGPLGSGARMKIVIGFVLSFGLAIVGVIAYEQYVNRKLQYPEQVMADLGLPILGVVPNLKALKPARVGSDRVSPQGMGAIESFRALRTQLTHGVGIEYPTTIAITSPSMGEGKSLVVTNLALAFADRGRRTVLIDGDVRRGGLHRLFDFPRTPGLSDYLRGEASAEEILRPTDSSTLHLIARGPYSEDVPELLDEEGLPALLDYLRERFDVILIDTPPLAAGVDAVLIGTHVDGVLAVLRTGRTDLDLARAKIASYAQMLGVPIIGAVLNDVQAEGPYKYYSYAYGYAHYPADDS